MATTLQASIILTDKMSSTLNSITASMDKLTAKLDRLDSRMDSAFNTTPINNATSAQNNYTQSVDRTTSSANGLLSALKKIAVAVGGIAIVKTMVDTSTQMTNTTARLNNINDGLQTTNELTEMIYASANRSYASFMDTADAVGKLAGQTGDLFESTKQVLQFSELLNKQFVISGTTEMGKASTMLQLTQAMSSGVLRGEEFNAINENANALVQIIADYMGVEKGQMKQLASEGKITSDIIKNAILGAGDQINETFEAMPITFADVMTKIKNIALQQFQPVWQEMEKFINSPEVQQAIQGITVVLGALASVVLGVMKVFAVMFNFIKDNFSWIAPIIMTVVGAMIAYKVATVALGVVQGVQLIISKGVGASFVSNTIALGVYNTATKVSTVLTSASTLATNILASAKMLLAGATWSAVIAEYGLLAPILLVIGVIVALIGAIFLIVKAYNAWTGSSVSAVGVIMGVFYTLGAFIYNLVGQIWNNLLSFAEFFLNVFNDPVYSVKKLFAGLAKAMINVMVATVSPIDSVVTSIVKACVSGIDWVLDKINGVVNAFGDILRGMGFDVGRVELGVEYNGSSVTEDLKGMSAGLDAWVGPEPSGYKNLDSWKLDAWDLGDAYNQGYDKGVEMEQSLSDMFDLNKQADELGGGANDAYGGSDVPGDIGDIANNTGSIADSVKATKEDLKYLVDVAKRNIVNRITSVDITVPITNNNSVNNPNDLIGMVDLISQQLATKVQEAIETSSEGVHE